MKSSKNYLALPQQLHGKFKLGRNSDLRSDLMPLMLKSSSTGCTYYELNILYQFIITKEPEYVLELGSGISTVVLAHAAKFLKIHGKTCKIISMEESARYYDELCRLFPKSVRAYVELIRSDVEESSIGDVVSRSYQDTPRLPYDLVFIDGPQVPKRPEFLDGDLLKILSYNNKAFVAYLDGRQSTRQNLMRMMPGSEFNYDSLHKWTRIDIPEATQRR